MVRWIASRGVRSAGALTAGAIALMWTPLVIPALTRVPDPDVSVFDPVTPALLTAVPVVAVLAYVLAPRFLAWSRRRTVLVYALLTVGLNALVMGEYLAFHSLLTTDLSGRNVLGEAVLAGPVLAMAGLLYIGPFALVPAAISAWAWLWAMRVMFRGYRRSAQASTTNS